MNVKDIMSGGVVTCEADSTLDHVATCMKEHDVGLMPIVHEEKVVGVITDRDLVTRALADGGGPDKLVRDVATPRIWSIRDRTDIADLAQVMKDKRVRRLIVTDQEDRPIGVVTLGDLAHHGDAALAGSVLEAISAPAAPQRIDERTEALPAFARTVASPA
ncbi:MAG: CBS domain-containing protein [bacterium]